MTMGVQETSYWKSDNPDDTNFAVYQVRKEVLFPTPKSRAYCLYRIVNLINGKVYVGQHLGKHSDKYMGSGKVLKRSIKKNGIENFKRINAIYTNNKAHIDDLEKVFIYLEKMFNPDKCYNIAEGGVGGDNLKYASDIEKQKSRKKQSESLKDYYKCPEVRKKHSESLKKYFSCPYARKKMSEAAKGLAKGRKHTIQTKEKIGLAHKGKFVSIETRQKMSESTKGKIISKEQRATISENQKGAKWYKNIKEDKEIFVYANKEVPEGYVRGRLARKRKDTVIKNTV